MNESLVFFTHKKLSSNCNFTAVAAVQSRNALIRNEGLCSTKIRQRFLEHNATEFYKARSVDDA